MRFALAERGVPVGEPQTGMPLAYGIRVAKLSRGPRALHALEYGSCTLWRSSDLDEVLDALLAHAAGQTAPEAGLVGLDGAAVVYEGRAVLLPADSASAGDRLRVAARPLGLQVVVTPVAWLDPAGPALVVPSRAPPARAGTGEHRGAAGSLPAKPGRHPLVRILTEEHRPQPEALVASLFRRVADPGARSLEATHEALAGLVARGLVEAYEGEVVTALARAGALLGSPRKRAP